MDSDKFRKVSRYAFTGVIHFFGEAFTVPNGAATLGECESAWAAQLQNLSIRRRKHSIDPNLVTAKDVLDHALTTGVARAVLVNTYEVQTSPGVWVEGYAVGKEDGSVEIVAHGAAPKPDTTHGVIPTAPGESPEYVYEPGFKDTPLGRVRAASESRRGLPYSNSPAAVHSGLPATAGANFPDIPNSPRSHLPPPPTSPVTAAQEARDRHAAQVALDAELAKLRHKEPQE